MHAIEIHGLKKTYANETVALRGVDLTVSAGEFFALLGANGAGKTTIIGILTALINKSGGHALIFGHDIEQRADEAKRLIGVVPQEFNFSIFEKVIDIIISQAGYYGVPKKEAMHRAEKILQALELWDKRDQVSRTLSGGMKRRLMIARALIHHPKLLILDEPTAGVDVELRRGMWDYLRRLNAEGMTILMTTHYLEEVEELCERAAIIKQGTIIKEDSVKNLMRGLEHHTFLVNATRAPSMIPGYTIRPVDADTFEVDFGKEHTITDLVNELAKQNIAISDIQPKNNRLEQLYLSLMRT